MLELTRERCPSHQEAAEFATFKRRTDALYYKAIRQTPVLDTVIACILQNHFATPPKTCSKAFKHYHI